MTSPPVPLFGRAAEAAAARAARASDSVHVERPPPQCRLACLSACRRHLCRLPPSGGQWRRRGGGGEASGGGGSGGRASVTRRGLASLCRRRGGEGGREGKGGGGDSLPAAHGLGPAPLHLRAAALPLGGKATQTVRRRACGGRRSRRLPRRSSRRELRGSNGGRASRGPRPHSMICQRALGRQRSSACSGSQRRSVQHSQCVQAPVKPASRRRFVSTDLRNVSVFAHVLNPRIRNPAFRSVPVLASWGSHGNATPPTLGYAWEKLPSRRSRYARIANAANENRN